MKTWLPMTNRDVLINSASLQPSNSILFCQYGPGGSLMPNSDRSDQSTNFGLFFYYFIYNVTFEAKSPKFMPFHYRTRLFEAIFVINAKFPS